MDNLTRVLFRAFDTHYINADHLKMSDRDTGNVSSAASLVAGQQSDQDTWTFITAVFFTSTLLTTIGRLILSKMKINNNNQLELFF